MDTSDKITWTYTHTHTHTLVNIRLAESEQGGWIASMQFPDYIIVLWLCRILPRGGRGRRGMVTGTQDLAFISLKIAHESTILPK